MHLFLFVCLFVCLFVLFFVLFEKFARAYLFQIALQIIRLPILIAIQYLTKRTCIFSRTIQRNLQQFPACFIIAL